VDSDAVEPDSSGISRNLEHHMAQLFELKKQREEALAGMEGLMRTAEIDARTFTSAELTILENSKTRIDALNPQIAAIENVNSIRGMIKNGKVGFDGGTHAFGGRFRGAQVPMTTEYTNAFLAFLRSGGKQASSELSEGFDTMFGGYALPVLPGTSAMSAALYEGTGGGSTTNGGFAVSVPTDGQIAPLALPDLGVRSLARVLGTNTDIKIPTQTTFGTAGIKAESGSSSNQFSESDPSLGQFTLSAYMVGLTHTVSWELLQDVALFQQFAVRDLINAIAIAEDGFFISGSGTAQPQGLIGNVGTGIGTATAVESTGNYLLQSTIEVTGTLKAQYYPNAAWLMSRTTATAIKQAQQQANLFAPVWTRENGRDFLHGYPVSYSSTMPSLPTAATAGVTPILFGSFSDGYVIGDRGGSGTYVKILDQPLATSGQTILLGYHRVDGRVRLAEALQAVTISHS
jgi:HK97 family phage major capsid protein